MCPGWCVVPPSNAVDHMSRNALQGHAMHMRMGPASLRVHELNESGQGANFSHHKELESFIYRANLPSVLHFSVRAHFLHGRCYGAC